MKIGLDVDNVVFSTFENFLRFHNSKYGKNLKMDEIKKYNLWEIGIGRDREESVRFMDEFFMSECFLETPFVEGAFEGINTLSENMEIYFITSRGLEYRRLTEDTLREYFPYLKEIYFSGDFSGNGESKAEICYKNNIDFYVDDCYEFLLPFREKRALLLKYPWNEDEWNKLKNLKRNPILPVKDWNEILKEVLA